MQYIFIETSEFSEWVRTYLDDDDLSVLQRDLLTDPRRGAVMPGCGGLRKLRLADPRRGKGKRGGARVVYLVIEELRQIHLITIYGKDQKDDLSAQDRELYRQFVRLLKDQARTLRED
ncbi:MAG TPA: hypothetical protein VG406_15810 [Isosphaeraceae bacterium]|jgi:hypothetical protein|nr:hypothetical protein [Isosphaeraceae bacterium]